MHDAILYFIIVFQLAHLVLQPLIHWMIMLVIQTMVPGTQMKRLQVCGSEYSQILEW